MGKSGQSVAVLAAILGARVTCFDQRVIEECLQQSLLSRIMELSSGAEQRLSFQQGHPKFSSSEMEHIDILILSPGIPASSSWLIQLQETYQKYHNKELEIASEVGFAASHTKTPILAITGTNGKSSSCWYLHQYVSLLGYHSFVGGNFGTALSEMVVGEIFANTIYDYAIVEISSYQMEFPYGFRPHVGVVLNLTPDHLARHKTMDVYAEMKKRIFVAQGKDDFCLYPFENDLLIPSAVHSKHIVLCSKKPLCDIKTSYLYIQRKNQKIEIIWKEKEQEERIFEIPPLQLLGHHNIQNIQTLIGIACCLSLPIHPELFQQIKPLEHRLEIVQFKDKEHISRPSNVMWINDSKATNVEATQAGIAATIEYLQTSNSPLSTNLFILLGGVGKDGANYEVLLENMWDIDHIHITIVCFGASASTIKDQLTLKFQNSKHIQMVLVSQMDDAISFCQQNITSHHKYHTKNTQFVILLSPACASFDAFDNFEHRGRMFCETVKQLYTSQQQNISSSIVSEAT